MPNLNRDMEAIKRRILVVEDSPETAEVLKRLLEYNGYQVSVALKGKEAIEKVASECPEAVLLDLILPDISGKEVLKRIKEIHGETGVIVMTGYGGEDVAVDLMKSGADDYLAKPFDNGVLLDALKGVLEIRDALVKDKKQSLYPSLEKFFPFLAHEVRNPLHAISGALTIIQRKSNLNDEILSRSVKIIQEEIHHLNEFVQECLDFVRPPARSRYVQIEIREVISAVTNILSHMFEEQSRKIKMVVISPNQLPQIYAHYEEIKKAFLNILKNSFEAIKDEGEIIVRTGFIPEPPPGKVEVVFEDNGPGIKKENLPYLFQPFFTTKLRGTGLGLAICHRIIVERHQGKVHIESEEGRGTTVRVELPVGAPLGSRGDEKT